MFYFRFNIKIPVLIIKFRFFLLVYDGWKLIVKVFGLFRVFYSFFECWCICTDDVATILALPCCCHAKSMRYWLERYIAVWLHYYHYSLINFNWLHKLCWCKIFLAKYLNLSIPSTIPFACCIIITVRLYLKKSLAIFILFILLLNPWLLNVAEFFLFESHDLHICTF